MDSLSAARDANPSPALAFVNANATPKDGFAASYSSSSTSPPTKRRRAAPIMADCCRTCRLRKVKCSGNPGNGPCTNCARLELSCNFANLDDQDEATVSRTTPSHSHTEAGTLRKRAQRACSQCHAHKTKCSGDLPRCKRCEASNLPCEYTPAKRRFTNVRFQNAPKPMDSQPSAPPSVARSDGIVSPSLSCSSGPAPMAIITDTSNLCAEDLMARKDLVLRHLDAYMNNVYWLPCQGFIHPEFTYLDIQEGTLDPVHAAGICAVASSFVNPNDAGREFGQKCSTLLELYLFQNVYTFSDNLLILFALNITFNVVQGSFAKVWQCFGIASRLMLGLRINWHVLPRGRSFIQQESLRRIGWHFFHMDRMLAGGYEEYICCRAENMKIPLPCDEASYRNNHPVVAERLYDKPGKTPSTINLHAYQMRLVDLRHRIQVRMNLDVFVGSHPISTTKRMCSSPSTTSQYLDASKIMADINGLQNELTRFHSSLPPDVLLSDQSIQRYMRRPERLGYVFLHCHLAGSHIDLYRFFLPGQREKVPIEILRKLPREFLARSQKQAVAHSMSFGRFCDAIQNEVDQIKDTGRLELAGDYSTIQLGTSCVRVLLVAIQHRLFHDITEESTAPLWRLGIIDEPHLRHLIHAVQRVIEPWCGILGMAKQAYDHNKALVEEFDRTRKVADQKYSDRVFRPRSEGDSRLPGPESLLESIAAGSMEDPRRQLSLDVSSADHWLRSAQQSPGATLPYSQSPQFDVEPGTPGIPLLLAQARTGSMDPSDTSAMYEAGNAMMGLNELNGHLPDGHSLMAPGEMPLSHMNGSIDPAMYHQGPPGPNPAFMMGQQDMFMDGYNPHYTNGHGDQGHYGQHAGYG